MSQSGHSGHSWSFRNVDKSGHSGHSWFFLKKEASLGGRKLPLGLEEASLGGVVYLPCVPCPVPTLPVHHPGSVS